MEIAECAWLHAGDIDLELSGSSGTIQQRTRQSVMSADVKTLSGQV